jgi:hypothetical protein
MTLNTAGAFRVSGFSNVAPVPYGHWKTSTIVAGLRTSGLTAPLILDGAMTGETYVGCMTCDMQI